jgi:hypothetical protein
MQFFPGEHLFQSAFLQFDSEAFWKEIIENAGLVSVGIDIDGSEATDADFLHFLLRNASGPVIGEDFAKLTKRFGGRSLDLNLVSRSGQSLLNAIVLPRFSNGC